MPETTHQFRLAPETVTKIHDLRNALEEETREHRDEWDERTERWQGGDKGQMTDAWIDALGDLVDTLDDVDEEPER